MSDNEQPDESSKTEDPTPRKLEEARRKGQVAISRELSTWILLAAGTLVIGTLAGRMMEDLTGALQLMIARAHEFPMGPGGVGKVLSGSFFLILKVMALPVLILMFAAFIGPFAQAGPVFSAESLKPDFQKISPVKGFERLFSKRSLIEFAKGLVKISVVGAVAYVVLKPYLPGAEHLVGMPLEMVMGEMLTLTLRLMTAALVVLMAFAVLDVVYQRYDLYQRLRMTKQEMKDEFRQTEGDPMVRGRLRQLRMERARQRMMQNVPKADVVVTNPTHFAVALQYVPAEMEAPKVLAKGADKVAFRIREVASEHGIEIVENPPLARALFDTVEIDQTVPPELYKAVAEVITYVFKKTGRLKRT